ncbi:hypothetical protein TNCV_2735551 [Trichonephila clavipes]|nr:hypothetical protein TNCV_2735551 [Trichonephila clavipes]
MPCDIDVMTLKDVFGKTLSGFVADKTATKQRKLVVVLDETKKTVVWICDRWIQEDTTDRSGQSHPPQYTTSCGDRQIVCIAVTNRSVTSGTVAQHIVSVTHH